MTSSCIKKVRELWDQEPRNAANIDKQMATSVQEAKAALTARSEAAQLRLSNSLQRAHDCFEQWGLINATLAQHIQQLKQLGALAAKPTGSGGGGFVLSLWPEKPIAAPQDPRFQEWIWL